MDVVLPSIEDWLDVVHAFRPDTSIRSETRHGVCFDMPGMTVKLLDTTRHGIPNSYFYPELVSDFRRRLSGTTEKPALMFERLYAWDSGSGEEPLDQIDCIQRSLRKDPQSRAAVFSTWRPEIDIESDYPPGQVAGAFRLVGNTLHLNLVGRSVDVWVGLVPALLAFSQLLGTTADELRMDPGPLIYHCWSAHLYEIDYLRQGEESNDS